MPLIADLELDMLAAALACDLTRVASFQKFDLAESHPLPVAQQRRRRARAPGPSDADARTQLIARQTWHSGRLAYMLSRLAGIQEADGGSVLDNPMGL